MLCMAAVVCSCQGDKKWKIGISQPSSDQWRDKFNGEVFRQALINSDRVTVRTVSAGNDPVKQAADIERLIADGCDLLAVSPVDDHTVNPQIRAARERGIPVIVFDRDLDSENYDVWIGADNHVSGASAADYIASRLGPDGGTVIEFCGLMSSTPARGRHEGFVQELAKYPSICLLASVDARWTAEDAARKADSLLKIHPGASAVFAHNDGMAIAVAGVLDSLGRRGTITVGIDAVPDFGIRAVADSAITATMIYPTGGDEVIKTAIALLSGENVPKKIILPSALPIDASNAATMLQLAAATDDATEKVALLGDAISKAEESRSLMAKITFTVAVAASLIVIFAVLLLRVYRKKRRVSLLLMENNDQLAAQRDEIENLYAQLEEETQSRIAFFTNVSHDLRTPLTLIAEPVEQLERSASESQRPFAQLAKKNVDVLRRLVDQIMDFRKHETGHLRLNRVEIHPRRLLLETTEGFRIVAEKRKLHLVTDFDISDSFTAALDIDKFQRIAFNLLGNAINHCPEHGTVTVRSHADGGRIVLQVTNTGIPIPPEQTGRIFDNFYRATQASPHGSGIGLAVTKAFVELHGGSISVESTGKATTFTATFPVFHAEENQGGTAVSVSSCKSDNPGNSDERETFDAGKPTVLLIDDNRDILELLTRLLHEHYNVLTATDGTTGLRLANLKLPQAVVCDIMMEHMDGIAVLRALKAEPATAPIPVVMLSACFNDRQKIDSYAAGAAGYLVKPFNSDLLLSKLAAVVAASEPTDRISASSDESSGADNDGIYAGFMEAVREDISDSSLTVDAVAERMGVSRMALYRRIKAITGLSPQTMMRILRLEQARKMLITSDMRTNEIAYAVGYTSPSYFTKSYRQHFGELPMETRRRAQGK